MKWLVDRRGGIYYTFFTFASIPARLSVYYTTTWQYNNNEYFCCFEFDDQARRIRCEFDGRMGWMLFINRNMKDIVT
jgi:hypothetical protein